MFFGRWEEDLKYCICNILLEILDIIPQTYVHRRFSYVVSKFNIYFLSDCNVHFVSDGLKMYGVCVCVCVCVCAERNVT
jgi:hypothetical protein